MYLHIIRVRVRGQIISEPAVYIFWHSQMLSGWRIFKGRNFTALVSQSNDGEMLNRLLEKWNYNVIRGSSSKGGKEALGAVIDLVRNGTSAVITPDGPRGPAHEIKNGPLLISLSCNVPVIPVRITYSRKLTLKRSWDRFQIPLPFSLCKITFGDKFYYEKLLENDELQNFKQQIATQMS